MHTYVITYDPLMSDPQPTRLIEFVKSHALTYQYFVHHWGSIFLKSPAELTMIINTYKGFFAPNVWTVCEIQQPDLNSGGAASMQFWDWLNASVPPVLEHQV